MRALLILLTFLLAACQHPDAVRERNAEPAPERNLLMANVVIWWAHGNEPFWKFTADSGKLRFESLGEEAEYFPYVPFDNCLLYTSPSPRDRQKSRMPSSA